MEQPSRVPKNGTRLIVKELYGTGGMLINSKYLDCRRSGEVVTMEGWVPGHGGDVWWCKHSDGQVAAYCFTELEYEDKVGNEEYYIQDNRQYVGNDILWWAKDHKGYTCDVRKAHVFTKEEAEAICDGRKTDIMWPKKYIDDRISHHIDMQHCDRETACASTEEE